MSQFSVTVRTADLKSAINAISKVAITTTPKVAITTTPKVAITAIGKIPANWKQFRYCVLTAAAGQPLSIHASNGAVSIHYAIDSVDIHAPGPIAVEVLPLLKLLRVEESDVLSLSCDGTPDDPQPMRIASDDSTYKADTRRIGDTFTRRTIEPSAWVASDSTIPVHIGDLRTAIDRTLPFIADQSTRYAFNEVQLNATVTGGLRLLVTDGRRASIAKMPTAPVTADTTRMVQSALLKLADQLLPSTKSTQQDTAFIACAADSTIIHWHNITLSAPTAAMSDIGTFPPADDVFPKPSDTTASTTINANDLAKAAKKIIALTEKGQAVARVEFARDKGLILSTTDPSTVTVKLPCKVDGDNLVMGVSAAYLADIAAVNKGLDLQFNAVSATRPATFSTADRTFRHVVATFNLNAQP